MTPLFASAVDWQVIGLEVLPYFVASIPILALAVWIAYLRFDDRVFRTFALYLALRGLILVLFVWDATEDTLPSRVSAYLNLAVPFVILWFVHIARSRYAQRPAVTRRRVDRPLLFAILGVGLVVETLYFFNHSLYSGGPQGGPLYLVQEARRPLLAASALVLARDCVRLPAGAARTTLLLLSLGFVVEPAYGDVFFLSQSGARWALRGTATPPGWGIANDVVLYGFALASILLIALAIATLFRAGQASRDPAMVGSVRRYAILTFAAVGSALAIGIWFGVAYEHALRLPPDRSVLDYGPFLWALTTLRLFAALWLAALPAALFAGYAFSKHRLFDLPQRTRWTLEKGTLAGIFVALAFVGTEGAQYALQNFVARNDDAGAVVGVVGAGVLVFALTPLHRWAQRVSLTAMPDAKPIATMNDRERAALFREQVEFAWLDGTLERKERLLLDSLRGRLGLAPDVASRIEGEVVARSLEKRPPRTNAGQR
ncbi:MAG TPA: hypothetical protein VI818_02265 [Candidatus Thermoplasmatota archaeon]|nr:hypothetical protein [Candidatus Thermoplasmatota archaeon]